MNTIPAVSIIVPVYNRETTIAECIKSILRSEFTDFEIIIIDDGSTDGTSRICKQLAGKDNRIRYSYQENHGVSAARNHGIKLCKGEWITFVDSDDVILPFHLNVLNDENVKDADLLMTDCAHSITETYNTTCHSVHPVVSYNATEYIYNEYDPYNNPEFAVWNKFFRSQIIKAHGILFNEELSLGEDRIFVCSYLKHARKCCHFRQKSYIQIWRKNTTSLVQTLRTPADYLHGFHLNYLAMCALFPLGGGVN